jgi:hypothetical protein
LDTAGVRCHNKAWSLKECISIVQTTVFPRKYRVGRNFKKSAITFTMIRH